MERYKNRYWALKDGTYELHFKQYEKDVVVLKFEQDAENAEIFWYVSDLLKVEYDCISEGCVDDAKFIFEQMILNYYEDKIYYYEELLEQFQEGVEE